MQLLQLPDSFSCLTHVLVEWLGRSIEYHHVETRACSLARPLQRVSVIRIQEYRIAILLPQTSY